MIINTKQHLSDKANSFMFIKDSTIWKNDPSVNSVQDVIDDIHPYSISGYPRATKDVYGIIILAKKEDLFGGGNDSVITNELLMASLDKPYADTDYYGTVKLSSNADYDKGSDNSAVTSKTLHYSRTKEIATTSKKGAVKFATDKEVIDGTATNKVISPNQLKMGINKKHTPIGIATENNLGTVRISSVNDNYNGKINNGFAISPYSLNLTRATESKNGLVKLATKKEYDLNQGGYVVTPNLMKNDISKINDNSNKTKEAVNSYNDFLAKRPKIIKDIVDKLWGGFDESGLIDELITVGSIHTSYSRISSDSFMEPKGQSLNRNSYPKLFSVIGYNFGGSGDTFKLPDTQGLFLKMQGKSNVIHNSPMNKFTSVETRMFQVQDDRMGAHKHAGFSGYGEYKNYNGSTTSRDWYGAGYSDFDNATAYSSDGANLGGDDSLDPHWLIGQETRPWNMPVIYYMRVK